MDNQQASKGRKSPLFFIAIGVIAVAAGIGIKNLIHSFTHEITDNAQIEAAGIPVVCRISGYADSIFVSDYSEVKTDQILLQLDAKEYELAVQQAQADLHSAEAEMLNAEAGRKNADAALQVATTNKGIQQIKTDKAIRDYQRDASLLADGSITQKQADDSKINMEALKKMLLATEDQVQLAISQQQTASAQVKRASALIETRKAQLEQARLKLSYCVIKAPASGKLGKCNINKGQFLQAGQSLFTIINNESFWVVANFKETQLKNLKEGSEAHIIVDGYPDREVKGKIVSLSDATGARFALLPPDNATGNFVKVTQRVPVKIEIENLADNKDILRAGMSVTVEIKR
jgi:membrane fusion protein (multidrug efflux system)